MNEQPVVVHEDEREWEGWRDEEVAERGNVLWKTLLSGGLTPSRSLTLGVARVPSGGNPRFRERLGWRYCTRVATTSRISPISISPRLASGRAVDCDRQKCWSPCSGTPVDAAPLATKRLPPSDRRHA